MAVLCRLTGRQHAEFHLWIAQLASSLHLLSALLSCSPQCLQVAGEMHSSDHISDSSRDILPSNLTENLSRVSLHSKGVVLRPLLRLKDRPPDASVATELRYACLEISHHFAASPLLNLIRMSSAPHSFQEGDYRSPLFHCYSPPECDFLNFAAY